MFNLFKSNKNDIVALCNGTFISQENIHDEVFSKGLIGKCFAIKPADNNIYSPIKGEIVMIYPTKHALGIKGDNGIEIILHIGVDSVNLKGEGFNLFVNEKQKVDAGELLMNVDFDLIRNSGYFDDVICAFTSFNKLNIKENLSVLNKGDKIGECK